MKQNQFSIDQRVSMTDEDTGETVFGRVVSVGTKSVFIKWDDIQTVCEHHDDEFGLIGLIKSEATNAAH